MKILGFMCYIYSNQKKSITKFHILNGKNFKFKIRYKYLVKVKMFFIQIV